MYYIIRENDMGGWYSGPNTKYADMFNINSEMCYAQIFEDDAEVNVTFNYLKNGGYDPEIISFEDMKAFLVAITQKKNQTIYKYRDKANNLETENRTLTGKVRDLEHKLNKIKELLK